MGDKSYRITILLYLGILILPFAFFYAAAELKSVETGTEVIRQLGRKGGEMLTLPMIRDEKVRTEKTHRIEKTLKHIRPWVESQDGESYYMGSRGLVRDYESLLVCWNSLKKSMTFEDASKCWEKTKTMLFMIEKMVTLKQEHLKNTLYATLAGAMGLLLLLVFFIRSYIRYQLVKQDVHDPESHLFNHKYCTSAAEKVCAQADRSGHAFSVLSLRVRGLRAGETLYGKEERAKLLEAIGGYLAATTRLSDIACRYDDDHFLILLPETDEEQCRMPKERIEEGMKEHMQKIVTPFEMSVRTATRAADEKWEEFLQRVENG